MRIFSSNSTHKIDGKGRVSIPAGFRRVMERDEHPGVVYLIPQMKDDDAIEGMTQSHFFALTASINSMGPGPKAQKLRHLVIGRAKECQLDENGRIVLSADMRSTIRLGDEALFVGLGDTFEIWRPDVWLAREQETVESARDLLAEIPWNYGAGSAA